MAVQDDSKVVTLHLLILKDGTLTIYSQSLEILTQKSQEASGEAENKMDHSNQITAKRLLALA